MSTNLFLPLFVFLLLSSLTTKAQKIYSVDYENQADVKIFVVNYESQADLKVFKVKYENQVGSNEGKWFFTNYSNQAKKKIYFVRYESQADLKVFFVDYESQAGWRNKSKQHLMYWISQKLTRPLKQKSPTLLSSFLSLLSGSNQWPTDYKSVALPAELRRRIWVHKSKPNGLKRKILIEKN